MNKWKIIAGTTALVAVGAIASGLRAIKDVLEATDIDWDPFDEIMGADDMQELWYDTLMDLESEHFDSAQALIDGELPDVLMIGYGVHMEAFPSVLSGLWKVISDDADSQTPTEAKLRGLTLIQQLAVLVAMYETYTAMGVTERLPEIDDNLGKMHHLIDQVRESTQDEDD
jgi:hypothetical protein